MSNIVRIVSPDKSKKHKWPVCTFDPSVLDKDRDISVLMVLYTTKMVTMTYLR